MTGSNHVEGEGCERFCSYLPATPYSEDLRWADPGLIRETPSET